MRVSASALTHALPLCLLVLLPCWLHRAVLFGAASYGFEDFPLWYLPARLQVARAWASLQPITWDPWVSLGSPMAFNPGAGVFYPFNVLALGQDPVAGLHRMLVFHLVVGGFGVLTLARQAGCSTWPAVLAGGAWALSGPLASVVQDNPYHLTSAAWTPWVAALLWRGVQGSDLRRAIAAGGALALGLLKGEPIFVFFVALLCAGIMAADLGGEPPERRLRRLGRWVAFGALAALVAALLAAPQLGAMLAIQADSARGEGFALEERQLFSLAPLRLVTLVWPYFTGVQIPDSSLWGNGLDTGYRYLWTGIHAGLGPLIPGLLALAGPPALRRAAAWMLAVAAFGLVMALGRHTPVHGWVDAAVPGVSLFRYPEKWVLAWLVPGALLAGLGLEACLQRPRLWRVGAVAGALLALVSGGLAAGAAGFLPWIEATAMAPLPTLHAQAVDRIRLDGWMVGVTAAALAALAAVAPRLGARAAGPAVGILLLSQLGVAGQTLLPMPPGAVTDRPLARWMAAATPHERMRRTPLVATQNATVRGDEYVAEVARATGSAAVYSFSGHQRIVTLVGPPVLGSLHGLHQGLLGGPAALPYSRRAAVHHYLFEDGHVPAFLPDWIASGEAQVVMDHPGPSDMTVVRDLAALPRARWARGARVLDVATAAGLQEAVSAALRSPGLTADTVLLHPVDALVEGAPVSLAPPTLPTAPGAARVVFLEDGNDRVVLQVTCEAAGWLVLADAFASGWTAELDGMALPIFRADGTMRAVPVPAPGGTLTFRYRHPGVGWTLPLAGLGWLVWLGVCVSLFRRRRTGSAP